MLDRKSQHHLPNSAVPNFNHLHPNPIHILPALFIIPSPKRGGRAENTSVNIKDIHKTTTNEKKDLWAWGDGSVVKVLAV